LLFLLFPLSYSQPHSVHFSEATLRWFDLGDAVNVTVTMPSFTLCSITAGDSKVNVTMVRLLWDPGGIGMLPIDPVAGIDRPPVPLHASIGVVVHRELACCVISTLVPSSAHRDPFLAVSTVLLSTCAFGDQVPSVDQAPSLFQCSHPALSRPTVHNIKDFLLPLQQSVSRLVVRMSMPC